MPWTIIHRINCNCPFCSGRRVSSKNSLIDNFPDIAKEWNYEKNKNIDINTISFGTQKKVWWICPICNSQYECSVNHRVNNRGCPICNLSGKAQEIYKILKNNNFNFKIEYKFKDLKADSGYFMKYDFAIINKLDNVDALIEYDDLQHELFVPYMHVTMENFEKLQKYDLIKNNYAKENSIPLLRITYKDKDIKKVLSKFLSINLN
jgi:hypothetical protein